VRKGFHALLTSTEGNKEKTIDNTILGNDTPLREKEGEIDKMEKGVIQKNGTSKSTPREIGVLLAKSWAIIQATAMAGGWYKRKETRWGCHQ